MTAFVKELLVYVNKGAAVFNKISIFHDYFFEWWVGELRVLTPLMKSKIHCSKFKTQIRQSDVKNLK